MRYMKSSTEHIKSSIKKKLNGIKDYTKHRSYHQESISSSKQIHVVATGNAIIEAGAGSIVEARKGARVTVTNQGTCIASDGAIVTVKDGGLCRAYRGAKVTVEDGGQCYAYDGANVVVMPGGICYHEDSVKIKNRGGKAINMTLKPMSKR